MAETRKFAKSKKNILKAKHLTTLSYTGGGGGGAESGHAESGHVESGHADFNCNETR